jgi:hypothetical protein
MNIFDHKDLRNRLLQRRPQIMNHLAYQGKERGWFRPATFFNSLSPDDDDDNELQSRDVALVYCFKVLKRRKSGGKLERNPARISDSRLEFEPGHYRVLVGSNEIV